MKFRLEDKVFIKKGDPEDGYDVKNGREIGHGAFGTIFLVSRKSDG